MKNKQTKAAKPKPRPEATSTPLVNAYTKHLEWTDKQVILQQFFMCNRTLQNLRTKKEIIWSKMGRKIYYHLPSFVQLLEKNIWK